MIQELFQGKEKKVEYVELIYDLIFVYVIGRNNQLLHTFENGFVVLPAFMAYVMTTLAVIQIWNHTTYYVNIYGRHSVRDHVFLFINMFLLYFVGEGTTVGWQGFHTQYHIAWALILINIGVQYMIELKNYRDEQNRRLIIRMMTILFVEALIVLADIPVYQATGKTWMTVAAIVFGFASVLLFSRESSGNFVDFPHLTERAMLYVVFTFGEMIVAISAYFEGDFSLNSTYFALMAFLIVVGLFLSYGIFYDRIIDREQSTNGLVYMLLHIFIIFALNNITNGLEFMREEEIDVMPKMLFLIGSFLLFFASLFALGNSHAKARHEKYGVLCLRAAVMGAVFAELMIVLRNEMKINIAMTVVFVFMLFAMIYKYGKKLDGAEK